MTIISIHITVAPDGAISTATPLPAGEYKAEGPSATLRCGVPESRSPWRTSRSTMDPGTTASPFVARTCTATMAADPAFVDTNVLVYASQTQSAFYDRATAVLDWARQEQKELWISRQILREYLATVTRPQPDTPPLPMADALTDVGRLGRVLNIAEDGPEVFSELCFLLGRIPVAGKQVHDANIAATMGL